MADQSDSLALGSIIRHAASAASARRNMVLVILIISTLAGTVFDATLEPLDALRANGLFGLVFFYMQVLLTTAALAQFGLLPATHDPRRPTRGRFLPAFGQSVAYLVAVGCGLLLLVIPGLVLIVRWSLCLPALIGERVGITASFKRSWELTRGRWRTVLAVYAVVLLLFLVTGTLLSLIYPDYGRVPWGSALIVNSMISITFLVSWLLLAALYRGVREDEENARTEGA